MSHLRVPEQDEVVDKEDQGCSACSGFSDSVLRIFEAQKLFDVAEANFQGPTPGKDLQNLRRCQGQIKREEAIVAAAAAGSRTTTIRSRCWPALGYHKASMVCYQSLTCFP